MSSSAIPSELDVAIEHHRAGRFAEAEAIYQKILAENSNHVDCLQLLGALAGQTGRIDLAVDLIRRAIALNPQVASYHSNLGRLLCDQGRFDEAIVVCRQALGLNPNLADAHNNLANAFYGKGQLDEAIAAYRKALRIRPDHLDALKNLGVVLGAKGDRDRGIEVYRQLLRFQPDDAEAHNDLGNLLAQKGRLDEAIASYRRAIELAPDLASAYSNLGQALCDQGKAEDALAACRRAIHLKPDFAEAHNVLGLALTAGKRFDEAIAEFGRTLQLKPGFIYAHNNLGAALYQAGKIDEAILEYRRALELDPDDPQILTNLGLGLWARGRQDEAIAAYRRAIRFKSDFSEAHYNLSVSLLLKGEFEDGWREYEYRLHGKELTSRPRICSQPLWNGEELHGRTILLDAEQGYGDVIQFIRYVPHIVSRGGRVILMGYAEQVRLLEGVPGIEQILTREPLPAFDVYCPLASLPQVFATRLDSIPAEVPYLKADPSLAKLWGKKLGPRTDQLRVGLVWAGRPTHKRDRERSISLSQLAPLATAGGVTFYSLQMGEAASQANHPPPGMELLDLTADLRDFADTAGLISHLDLVVSVDTAVVHLAGAMGKPVWVLLSFVPDWRWLLDRDDSPWYPTMRLFRQKSPGEWNDVVRRVAHAIGRYPRSPDLPPGLHD
ncbi:MAG: tetratricopeptide repeat protein [Tepidisphaeraceae bacterium]